MQGSEPGHEPHLPPCHDGHSSQVCALHSLQHSLWQTYKIAQAFGTLDLFCSLIPLTRFRSRDYGSSLYPNCRTGGYQVHCLVDRAKIAIPQCSPTSLYPYRPTVHCPGCSGSNSVMDIRRSPEQSKISTVNRSNRGIPRLLLTSHSRPAGASRQPHFT
jgi:hypothetical protein